MTNVKQQTPFRRAEMQSAHDEARRLRSRLASLAGRAVRADADAVATAAEFAAGAVEAFDALACGFYLLAHDGDVEPLAWRVRDGAADDLLRSSVPGFIAETIAAGTLLRLFDARDVGATTRAGTVSLLGTAIADADGRALCVAVLAADARCELCEEDSAWLSVAVRLVAGRAEHERARGQITRLEQTLASHGAAQVAKLAGERPDAAPAKPCVFVIDDDRALNDVLCEFLEVEGFGVEAAYDGIEAMRLFRPAEHHVVITDVAMPNMNGWELIAALRVRAPQLPILLITGYNSGHWNEAFLRKQGVVAAFGKPLDYDRLADTIKDLCDVSA